MDPDLDTVADSDIVLYMFNNKFSVIKQISDGSGSLSMIRIQLELRVGSGHLEIYMLESHYNVADSDIIVCPAAN